MSKLIILNLSPINIIIFHDTKPLRRTELDHVIPLNGFKDDEKHIQKCTKTMTFSARKTQKTWPYLLQFLTRMNP